MGWHARPPCSKPESGRLCSLVLNSTQKWLGPWCARLNPAATACTNGASVVSSGGALHQLNASSLIGSAPVGGLRRGRILRPRGPSRILG
uniref:Uncharacterized protein n=1 Tax=Arundo donax TaxID=35708 RepID=A0A0A8XSU2_ARUDO